MTQTLRTRTCDTCGNDYEYERVTSKYCSDTCRYRKYQGRKSTRHRLPADLRYSVLYRYNFRCVACGASPRDDPDVKLHVDHIQALANGGAEMDPRNLQVLCADCNLGKSQSD